MSLKGHLYLFWFEGLPLSPPGHRFFNAFSIWAESLSTNRCRVHARDIKGSLESAAISMRTKEPQMPTYLPPPPKKQWLSPEAGPRLAALWTGQRLLFTFEDFCTWSPM